MHELDGAGLEEDAAMERHMAFQTTPWGAFTSSPVPLSTSWKRSAR